MTEIQKQTSEINRYCELQARCMARFSEIAINDSQIDQYSSIREVMKPNTLSDQQLLYSLLDPLQKAVFRLKHSHIAFEE